MRKTKLPIRELEIGRRLREIRERLSITHADCSRRLGVPRTTFVNYEVGKAPLWCEIGLRFCREFLVSEEWLATGNFSAMEAESVARGLIQPGDSLNKELRDIFLRQTVDLHSDPVSRMVPPGALFSEAYDTILALRYRALVAEYYYWPRIVLSDHEGPEIQDRLIEALLAKWRVLLPNESVRLERDPEWAQRALTRCVVEAMQAYFFGFLTCPRGDAYNWAKAVAEHFNALAVGGADAVLSSSVNSAGSQARLTSGVQAGSGSAEMLAPKNLNELIRRVRRTLKDQGIPQNRLAKDLGVTRQAVNLWFTQGGLPSGEVALRLAEWLEGPRATTRSPASVTSTSEAKTRKGKSNNESLKSSRAKH